MQICELNCEFNIEWHSILSGGKPTFPTCEFLIVEWCPQFDFSFFSQLLPWWDFGLLRLVRPSAPKHILLRNLIVRFRNSHQPFIKPADDMLQSLNAMPGLT